MGTPGFLRWSGRCLINAEPPKMWLLDVMMFNYFFQYFLRTHWFFSQVLTPGTIHLLPQLVLALVECKLTTSLALILVFNGKISGAGGKQA